MSLDRFSLDENAFIQQVEEESRQEKRLLLRASIRDNSSQRSNQLDELLRSALCDYEATKNYKQGSHIGGKHREITLFSDRLGTNQTRALHKRLQKIQKRINDLLIQRRRIAPLSDEDLKDKSSSFWGAGNHESYKMTQIDAFCKWKGAENEVGLLENDLKLMYRHAITDVEFLEAAFSRETRFMAKNLIRNRIDVLEHRKESLETLFHIYGISM